jgi:glycosyltransferase involved in cell wall biosynthesis
MRIMLLVDSFAELGGAERLVGHIATRLDPQRFDVTVCATRLADDASLRAAELAGVRVLLLQRRRRLSLAAWLRLYRALRHVDVLHAHKFGSNVWGVLLGRAARVPVVIAHEHTWSFEGEPLRRFLDRHLVSPLSDRFLAVSELDARRMVSVEGIDPASIEVIRNGIPDLPPGDGARVRDELGVAREAPVVGTVCVLRPQKGVDHLLEAAAVTQRAMPGLRLIVAGDGPERAALEAQADRLGLGEAVIFAGARRDVGDVLAAFDVAVLASDFEGTPLALLEYMAAARPIVATSVGGIPDVLEDGVTGLLVPPRDVAALAGALVSLLGDEPRRRSLGAAARALQQCDWTIDATVGALAALYERLHEEGSGRRGLSTRSS